MKFKLTENDKEYLLKIGHPQSDFKQIERAANISQFEKITSDKSEKINMETALTLAIVMNLPYLDEKNFFLVLAEVLFIGML